jgi:outer membrane protein TolC
LQKEKWRQDEHAIKERIAQAYLNVLLRELQSRIAKDNETRFADYYRIAEGKLQNGAMIENDLLKAKLDLDNAQIETQKAIQNLSIARLQLNYQLNIDATSPVALSDKLETLQLTNGLMSIDQILENRSELRQLVLQKKSVELNYQRSKIGAVPTLSFFANYSQQYMNMNFNIGQGQWWTPFSYVGLRLNVPISAYYKNKTEISSNVVRMKQIDMQIEQRKSDVRYQSESSVMELTNATRNKIQAEENYKLSQRIYSTQKSHYAQGSLQYQSLLDTEKSLSMAEQNYIRSIYDLMVAQINYQRAIGEY